MNVIAGMPRHHTGISNARGGRVDGILPLLPSIPVNTRTPSIGPAVEAGAVSAVDQVLHKHGYADRKNDPDQNNDGYLELHT